MEKNILLVLLVLTFALLLSLQVEADEIGSDAEFQKTLKLMEGLKHPKWHCKIDKQVACNKDKCTEFEDLQTYFKLDVDAGLHERCDNKGCNSSEARFIPSGIYTYVKLYNSLAITKILNDGSEFMDSATLMSSFVNSFGSCKAIK